MTWYSVLACAQNCDASRLALCQPGDHTCADLRNMNILLLTMNFAAARVDKRS
jgi:hypothetical protein